jgi:hypothetical protein
MEQAFAKGIVGFRLWTVETFQSVGVIIPRWRT